MRVIPISKQKFYTHNFYQESLVQTLTEERSWFEEESRRLVGVVLRDRADRDWAWVMLAKDRQGRFFPLQTHCAIKTQKLAVKQLRRAMVSVAERGNLTVDPDSLEVSPFLLTEMLPNRRRKLRQPSRLSQPNSGVARR